MVTHVGTFVTLTLLAVQIAAQNGTMTTAPFVIEEAFSAVGGKLAFLVRTDGHDMASIGVMVNITESDPGLQHYITPDATGAATRAVAVSIC